MVEYINSLKGHSSVPNNQSQLAFDSSALENQQLLEDLKKGKMITSAVFGWISLVTNQVVKLMQNLHEIVSLARITLDESHV